MDQQVFLAVTAGGGQSRVFSTGPRLVLFQDLCVGRLPPPVGSHSSVGRVSIACTLWQILPKQCGKTDEKLWKDSLIG